MRSVFRRLLAGALVLTGLSAPAAAIDNPFCRQVGSDWTWFGDHVALSIRYFVAGPPGRRYEIGTGLSVNGQPWGSKSTHEGAYAVTAYGAGAIHIRAHDGGPPFDICVSAGKMDLIQVCGPYRLDCSF